MVRVNFRKSTMEEDHGKSETMYHYNTVFVEIIKEMKEGYASHDEIRGITRYVYFYCYIHW